MNDFKIVKTRKYQKLFFTIFVIIASALSYLLGYYQFEQNLYQSIGGQKELVKKLYIQTQKVEALEKENIKLQQVVSLNEKSRLEIKRELTELSSKNDKVVEELMLYKRILDPDSAQLSVVINKLSFYPVKKLSQLNLKVDLTNKQLFAIDMVLINHLLNKNFLDITAQCHLIDANNEVKNIDQIFDHQLNKIARISFKFKYFLKYKVYFLFDKGTEFTRINCSFNEKKNYFKTINIEQNIHLEELDNFDGEQK